MNNDNHFWDRDKDSMERVKRAFEKLPFRKRVARWFWGTRVGVAINALLGRTTLYRAHIKNGTIIVSRPSLIVDCRIDYSAEVF